jgi:hypothetical protein
MNELQKHVVAVVVVLFVRSIAGADEQSADGASSARPEMVPHQTEHLACYVSREGRNQVEVDSCTRDVLLTILRDGLQRKVPCGEQKGAPVPAGQIMFKDGDQSWYGVVLMTGDVIWSFPTGIDSAPVGHTTAACNRTVAGRLLPVLVNAALSDAP